MVMYESTLIVFQLLFIYCAKHNPPWANFDTRGVFIGETKWSSDLDRYSKEGGSRGGVNASSGI